MLFWNAQSELTSIQIPIGSKMFCEFAGGAWHSIVRDRPSFFGRCGFHFWTNFPKEFKRFRGRREVHLKFEIQAENSGKRITRKVSSTNSPTRRALLPERYFKFAGDSSETKVRAKLHWQKHALKTNECLFRNILAYQHRIRIILRKKWKRCATKM